MKWKDVRQAFPDSWVLIEATQAYTNNQNERILEEIVPLNKFTSSPEAMRVYQEIHQDDPTKELYVLHTSRKEPKIIEKSR